jgi:hypothetical protein
METSGNLLWVRTSDRKIGSKFSVQAEKAAQYWMVDASSLNANLCFSKAEPVCGPLATIKTNKKVSKLKCCADRILLVTMNYVRHIYVVKLSAEYGRR